MTFKRKWYKVENPIPLSKSLGEKLMQVLWKHLLTSGLGLICRYEIFRAIFSPKKQSISCVCPWIDIIAFYEECHLSTLLSRSQYLSPVKRNVRIRSKNNITSEIASQARFLF
ncbi:hypothetical protein TNIN_309061 [Trichonephila inaurata madagascariensis]|uniref:Uncharacterized protein n=1 Tax=Trichonephila inaurata madagascariensis TaxID=2747483 RepID=A0A8X6WSS9_9ARAC|nr:hypothetical protein TNIN_309061 [Trichonephila inaurata madagascariensis]